MSALSCLVRRCVYLLLISFYRTNLLYTRYCCSAAGDDDDDVVNEWLFHFSSLLLDVVAGQVWSQSKTARRREERARENWKRSSKWESEIKARLVQKKLLLKKKTLQRTVAGWWSGKMWEKMNKKKKQQLGVEGKETRALSPKSQLGCWEKFEFNSTLSVRSTQHNSSQPTNVNENSPHSEPALSAARCSLSEVSRPTILLCWALCSAKDVWSLCCGEEKNFISPRLPIHHFSLQWTLDGEVSR